MLRNTIYVWYISSNFIHLWLRRRYSLKRSSFIESNQNLATICATIWYECMAHNFSILHEETISWLISRFYKIFSTKCKAQYVVYCFPKIFFPKIFLYNLITSEFVFYFLSPPPPSKKNEICIFTCTSNDSNDNWQVHCILFYPLFSYFVQSSRDFSEQTGRITTMVQSKMLSVNCHWRYEISIYSFTKRLFWNSTKLVECWRWVCRPYDWNSWWPSYRCFSRQTAATSRRLVAPALRYCHSRHSALLDPRRSPSIPSFL